MEKWINKIIQKINERFQAKLCNFFCNNPRELLKPLGQLFWDHPNFDGEDDDDDDDNDDYDVDDSDGNDDDSDDNDHDNNGEDHDDDGNSDESSE